MSVSTGRKVTVWAVRHMVNGMSSVEQQRSHGLYRPCPTTAGFYQGERHVDGRSTSGARDDLTIIDQDLIGFRQGAGKQLLELIDMFEVKGAAPVLEQPCLGKHEAGRAKAHDGGVVLVGVAQIAQGLFRVIHAPWQKAADYYEVVESSVLRQKFMRAHFHAATRSYGSHRGCNDLPVTVDLPAEVRLVSRMAKAVDERGERREREVRRQDETHAHIRLDIRGQRRRGERCQFLIHDVRAQKFENMSILLWHFTSLFKTEVLNLFIVETAFIMPRDGITETEEENMYMKFPSQFPALTAAVTILASTFAVSSGASDVRLRIAGQHPIEHYATGALNQIKADLDAADVGLDVKLFPAGQLGNGEEVFGDVIQGVIDVGHTFVYSHNDPKLEINSIPYLVSNYEQMARVFSPGSAFYTNFDALMDKQGVKLLGIFVEGFIGVATSEAPENPTTTGPKGLNIRVWSAEAARSAATDMGFNTTTMNWGDVPAAIQQGTVDGLIGGTAESYYTIMRDAISHYIPYNAFVENTAYYMSKRTWEKLNEAQRNAVTGAFQDASRSSFEVTERLDKEYTQKLVDAGIEVISLTDAELAAIAAEVQAKTWPLLEEKLGAELLAQLKEE